jgi:hypothetical protein
VFFPSYQNNERNPKHNPQFMILGLLLLRAVGYSMSKLCLAFKKNIPALFKRAGMFLGLYLLSDNHIEKYKL